jgi:anaerobic selenocysteine-containing dehydrogenase
MDSSRRRFLKIAGIAALGLGTQPVLDAVAADASHGTQPSVRKSSKALLQNTGPW